eukprot:3767009-Pyramimonas_sp.AAC.1
MEDFRARRASEAAASGGPAGIRWHFLVNENLVKNSHIKSFREDGGKHRDVDSIVIGDFGYADDTGICGMEEEVQRAEGTFVSTLVDWEERVNQGKTERLRASAQGRRPCDVRGPGEVESARHVGGVIAED